MGCCKGADNAKDGIGMIERKDRKCRDVLCCIFFVLFWIGMIAIASIGLQFGEPERLFYGTDYRGKVCKVDSGLEEREFIVYPRIYEDFLINFKVTNPLDYRFYGICVEKCPGVQIDAVTGRRTPDIVCNDNQYPDPTSNTSYYTKYKVDPAAAANIRLCLDETGGVYCDQIEQNCWLVPQNTEGTFFRCIPEYEIKYTVNSTCEYPASITDPNDSRCQLVREEDDKVTIKPAKPNLLFDQFNEVREVWSRYFADLQRAWWVIFLCGGAAAVVISFIWLIFLRCCTGCMVWTSLFLVVTGLTALTFYCYFKAGILDPAEVDNLVPSDEFKFERQELEQSEDYKKAFKYIAFALTAVTIIVLCLIVALRKQIKTAIQVVKQAAKALHHNPMVIFYPIFTVLQILALLVYWVFIAAALASAGEIKTQDVASSVDSAIAEFENTPSFGLFNSSAVRGAASQQFESVEEFDWSRYMLIYHFFGLLWTNQFINGLGLMVIALTIAGWYHSQRADGDKTTTYKQPTCGVCSNLWVTIRYYMGSVAFGAFLIALVQFLRACLAYIQRQLKRQGGNRVVQQILCCVQCCMKILEKVVQAVTRNAYIFIAVKGMGFCSAGMRVFKLIVNNMATLAVVNLIGEIVLFLSKVFVSCACAWLAFWILEREERFQRGGEDELSAIWLTVVVTMIFAFAISSGFFYVFDMTMDTILVCYILDKDEHDGVAVHSNGSWLAKKNKKGRQSDATPESGVELKANPANGTAPTV